MTGRPARSAGARGHTGVVARPSFAAAARPALLALVVVASLPLGACGGAGARDAAASPAAASPQDSGGSAAPDTGGAPLRARPTAVEPVAGLPSQSSSTPAPAADAPLPQPVSDDEIRRELAAAGVPAGGRAALTRRGLAVAPLDSPPEVQAVIAAGNQIARLPYRYGGGHATWIDTAYDCSASVSFAFAAAGLVRSPMDSTALSGWGDPGAGRWITVYANGGHAWMTVAGLRFDTGGLRVTGSRWQTTGRGTGGFVARHPAGL